MRTIRGKITAMTVAAILVCVAALGSISIFSIKSRRQDGVWYVTLSNE